MKSLLPLLSLLLASPAIAQPAWIPLEQSEADVTFVQLDNDSLLLGHRTQNFGAYIGYERQRTNTNEFEQIALGLEFLGNIEFRVNAYLPIGNTRQLAYQSENITSSVIRGNQLILRSRRDLLYERALAGIDGELGLQLFQGVKGYAGLSYFDEFNGSARLEIKPHDNIAINLQYQSDDDTWLASVRIGIHSNPVRRRNRITIAEEWEIMLSETIAVNPETEQPYHVILVAPVESPVESEGNQNIPLDFIYVEGTQILSIEQGLSLAEPGDLVYVHEIDFNGNLTIPPGVALMSSASSVIPTLWQGKPVLAPLPHRGTGRRPSIFGSVTMNNNTALSGFAVVEGITANLDNGTLSIENNRISNPNGDGIFVNAMGTSQIAIANNEIANTRGNAIEIETNGISRVDLAIQGNTIDNSRHAAIFLDANDNSRMTALITANQITNAPEGISIDAANFADVAAEIARNNINAANDAIKISDRHWATGSYKIYDNTLVANDDGVDINQASRREVCVALDNNTAISNTGYELDPNGWSFKAVDLGSIEARNTGDFFYETGIAGITDVSSCP